MNRELRLTPAALDTLRELERSPQQENLLKQVRKTLGLLETNPRHPSLQTHKFRSLHGLGGEEVFEAYVQNQTSAAYRIFFYYGPDRLEGKRRIPVLTIVAITPHP
jgi:hypothetical protein